MLIGIYNKATNEKGKCMLNDVVIVESAISAFNNAALMGPAFLWWAVLALPLFVVVFWCRDSIVARLGWNDKNILKNVSMWTAGLTGVWIVLFGGNYAVLRDSLSVLPMVIATIVFLASLFVSSHLRTRPLPRMNRWWWLCVLGVIAIVALSDVHVWWGPLLQVGALMLGGVLGRYAKAEMRPVAGIILIVLMTAVAILMQPEFFRFGQLGNLMLGHVVAVLVLGVVAMMSIAVLNINARGKIKQGVFIKLKWLMRVMCAFGMVLFVITEAVPVFLGTLALAFVMFAMSVWHAQKFDVVSGYKMFALVLMCFGVITVMPVIVGLGILYWGILPQNKIWRDFKALL